MSFHRFKGVNIRLNNADFAKFLLCVLSGDRRRNDDVVTRQPIDRGGDTVLVSGLESFNDTEDLGSVSAGGSRVGKDKANLLVGVNDEDRADRQSQAWSI